MRASLVRLALVCACLALACERAGDGDTQRVADPVSGPARQIEGFVIGQVATRPGPQSDRPIEGLDGGDVGRRFRAAVRDLAMFHEEGGPGPVIDFELEYGVGLGSAETPPPGTGAGTDESAGEYVVLYLAAEGGAAGDPRYQFELQGLYRERVLPAEPPIDAANRLVDEGIADLVENLRAEAAPRVTDDAGVVRLLDQAEGPDELFPVIREVHRRRLAAAAPALRELLTHEDTEVIVASASALGRVRDDRAVAPLIELISRQRRELTPLVLPILGDIGSRDARAYLETVAEGHDDPQIRQMAQQILGEMADAPR